MSLVDLALSNNMPAIALTDNGNLFGALEFSLKAAKKGLQPILGCILDIDLEILIITLQVIKIYQRYCS